MRLSRKCQPEPPASLADTPAHALSLHLVASELLSCGRLVPPLRPALNIVWGTGLASKAYAPSWESFCSGHITGAGCHSSPEISYCPAWRCVTPGVCRVGDTARLGQLLCDGITLRGPASRLLFLTHASCPQNGCCSSRLASTFSRRRSGEGVEEKATGPPVPLRKVQISQKSPLMPAVTWLAVGTSPWPHPPRGTGMQVLKKIPWTPAPGRRSRRMGRMGVDWEPGSGWVRKRDRSLLPLLRASESPE